MSGALYSPAIVVNNVTVAIKPNSFAYTEGNGERKIRVASSGGSATQNCMSEDFETAFSMCKFTVYATLDNVALVKTWLTNKDANVVQASDELTGFTRTFQEALIINNPEVALGVDGEIEVEWNTRPAV